MLPKTKYNLVVANLVDFTEEDHFVSGLKIYEIYVLYHHSLLGKGNGVFSPFIVLFSGALRVLTIIVIARFTSYSNPHKS